MDGKWEPPKIKNPKCETVSGCGKWARPQIKNPNYKGKWKAPKIKNPNYKVRLLSLEAVKNWLPVF